MSRPVRRKVIFRADGSAVCSPKRPFSRLKVLKYHLPMGQEVRGILAQLRQRGVIA